MDTCAARPCRLPSMLTALLFAPRSVCDQSTRAARCTESNGCGRWSPRRMRRRMSNSWRKGTAALNCSASTRPSLTCARGATLSAPKNPPAVTHIRGLRHEPMTTVDSAITGGASSSLTINTSHGSSRHGDPTRNGRVAADSPRARNTFPDSNHTCKAPCCTTAAADASSLATTQSWGVAPTVPHAAPFSMVTWVCLLASHHRLACCWH